MRPMKYKNDLEMWHKFSEFAEQLKFVAHAEEHSLIFKCRFYSEEEDCGLSIFEEHCDHPSIKRKGDFNSDNECWKCRFYKQKKEELEKHKKKEP